MIIYDGMQLRFQSHDYAANSLCAFCQYQAAKCTIYDAVLLDLDFDDKALRLN